MFDEEDKAELYKDFDKEDRKEKEENESEEKEEKEVFTQMQREMLKMSIYKLGMRKLLNMQEYQGAENLLISQLTNVEDSTREKYLDEVQERAKNEGVSEYDIMAEDAIQIKKAEMSNSDVTVDPTTGRLDICSQTGEAQVQDGEEIDEEYEVLDSDSIIDYDCDDYSDDDEDNDDLYL